MTCTKCNGTGFVELFTSKEPCSECQVGFDDDKGPGWTEKTWDDLTIVDTSPPEPDPSLVEAPVTEEAINYRNSLFGDLGFEIETDGDEIKILVGDYTFLTESKQRWSIVAGLSHMPEDADDDQAISFYPQRATKTRFDVKVFSDENGWHATLRGNLDLSADGETVHEALEAVIQKAGLSIQTDLLGSSDAQQQLL